MLTPSDLMATLDRAIAEHRLGDLAIVADMAEDLGYADPAVLDEMRVIAVSGHDVNDLRWWVLKRIREHFGYEENTDA